MAKASLVMHGVDTLFPNGYSQLFDPAWAKKRFTMLLWPFLWKAILGIVFCTTGFVLVARIDWAQTGVLIVPGVFLIALGLWNAFLACDRLCVALSGFAVIAVLNSAPLRTQFQGLAKLVESGMPNGDVYLYDNHPYGVTRTNHRVAKTHLHHFQTTAAIVAPALHHREEPRLFPAVGSQEHAILIVDAHEKEWETPILLAVFPTSTDKPTMGTHALWFNCLRWVAAKANVQDIHIGLPLNGNPQGSAHERMAFWASLANTSASPT